MIEFMYKSVGLIDVPLVYVQFQDLLQFSKQSIFTSINYNFLCSPICMSSNLHAQILNDRTASFDFEICTCSAYPSECVTDWRMLHVASGMPRRMHICDCQNDKLSEAQNGNQKLTIRN